MFLDIPYSHCNMIAAPSPTLEQGSTLFSATGRSTAARPPLHSAPTFGYLPCFSQSEDLGGLRA